MVEMDVVYEGKLHCNVTHGPSGNVISTDAPKDNQGLGQAFSPTDLLCASLGSCMMTIIGIYGQRHEIELAGATVHVTKEMILEPVRRVGKITLTFKLPNVPSAQRDALEKAAHSCPVIKSIHPDIQVISQFVYA